MQVSDEDARQSRCWIKELFEAVQAGQVSKGTAQGAIVTVLEHIDCARFAWLGGWSEQSGDDLPIEAEILAGKQQAPPARYEGVLSGSERAAVNRYVQERIERVARGAVDSHTVAGQVQYVADTLDTGNYSAVRRLIAEQ